VRAAARRPYAGHPKFDGWLRLESSGWYVQVDDFLVESAASDLVGEDVAWHFAVADWHDRRPHVWQRRARRAWHDEEQVLAAQASRLVEASTHLRTLRPMSDANG
jgi:hypothetical protein